MESNREGLKAPPEHRRTGEIIIEYVEKGVNSGPEKYPTAETLLVTEVWDGCVLSSSIDDLIYCDPFHGSIHARPLGMPRQLFVKQAIYPNQNHLKTHELDPSECSNIENDQSSTVKGNNTCFPAILPILHTISSGRAWMWLQLKDQKKISNLHQKMMSTGALRLVSPRYEINQNAECSEEYSMVAVSVIRKDETVNASEFNNQVETSIRGFLVYALPKFSLSCCLSNNNPISETAMSDPVGPDVLSNGQLGLVFGVEYTLLAIHDLYRNPPPRATEMAMLREFHETGCVTLPGGTRIAANLESSLIEAGKNSNVSYVLHEGLFA